jgi:hypothetical protein
MLKSRGVSNLIDEVWDGRLWTGCFSLGMRTSGGLKRTSGNESLDPIRGRWMTL